MIKKIGMWSFYVLIVGLLVYGAVNRTAAKTNGSVLLREANIENESEQTGYGSEKSLQSMEITETDHKENPSEHDWVKITGKISSVENKTLEVQSDDYGLLEISGRSWRFAQESGFIPEVGNRIELNGFFENDEFKVSEMVDITAGNVVIMRDDSGQPLWGGGGS